MAEDRRPPRRPRSELRRGASARRRGERGPLAPGRHLRSAIHRGASGRPGDPRGRGGALGRGVEHRPRVPQGRAPRRGARNVRARSGPVRTARGHARGPTRCRAHERLRRGRREDPRRLRDQLGAPSGGQAAREPDPDAGRRRSPAVAATDRRTVRSVVGVLRRDARRTRDRADPRHGARGRPAPARGGGLRDLGPAGRSRRSRASTRSTSTSRVRTCRPTTAARRTSGTSSR